MAKCESLIGSMERRAGGNVRCLYGDEMHECIVVVRQILDAWSVTWYDVRKSRKDVRLYRDNDVRCV
jgi:hypothetical protein